MPLSARSGRTSTLNKDKHLEMRLVADLNSFYHEREINLEEMTSSIR